MEAEILEAIKYFVQFVEMGAVFDGTHTEVLPAQLPDKVCYEGSFP